MNSFYENSPESGAETFADAPPAASLAVYENLRFIGQSTFKKGSILIGKSGDADLVLDHQAIADIHALIRIDRDEALLINKNINNGLRLNGLSVKESSLKAEDVIQLGPFSIVFRPALPAAATPGEIPARRIDPPAAGVPGRTPPPTPAEAPPAGQRLARDDIFAVILVDRYPTIQARREAISQLARLLRISEATGEQLMGRPRPVLKRHLERLSAFRLQDTLHDLGIVTMVRAMDAGAKPSLLQRAAAQASRPRTAVAPGADPSSGTPIAAPKPAAERRQDLRPEMKHQLPADEEEETEEIWETPFTLEEKLLGPGAWPGTANKGQSWVQVIKTLDGAVVDMVFVAEGQKYYLHRPQGAFCLVENRADEQAYLFIDPHLSGHAKAGGHGRCDVKHYRTDAYLHRKRKEIYRLPFTLKESALITDGSCQYHLSMVPARVSPGVTTVAPPKPLTWRHWAVSAAVHLLVVVCISIYGYLNITAPKPQTPHFVKVDMQALRAPEPKQEIAPEPPKPPPPTPAPEPQRVVEKAVPVEQKAPPKTVAKRAVQKTSPEKKQPAVAQAPSRDPNAGGGFGEGNIANRNVNQTGLLSILSKNALPGPSTAIASVTNLDAVQVPGATEKNFTVGGIKGSLGSGKISMGGAGAIAPGTIVETKGSKQVLRSAGAGGSGEVAALERGTTGQKQVKALVTAKMTQTVKVEGGMSREMVKQVIDQHLGEITFCYESALAGNPNIMGRVIFEWKILLSGRVGEIRIVASNINSNSIHDCIKSAIKSWQFPNPAGAEVIVSYPFVFDLVAF
jgi:outer membrane biosynthesis protein TonB